MRSGVTLREDTDLVEVPSWPIDSWREGVRYPVDYTTVSLYRCNLSVSRYKPMGLWNLVVVIGGKAIRKCNIFASC